MSHGIRPTGFKVRIKMDRCINCGKCIKTCARRNFRANADGNIEIVHLNNCNGCTKCRDVCATKAIAVAPDPMRGSEHMSPIAKTDSADRRSRGRRATAVTGPHEQPKGEAMAYTTAKEAIDRMPLVFDAGATKGLECVYQLNITGDGGGAWNLTVKDGACTLQEGKHAAPTVTLTMSDTTWLSIVNKKMNAMQAGMTGRVKTVGSMLFAQKITTIFPL